MRRPFIRRFNDTSVNVNNHVTKKTKLKAVATSSQLIITTTATMGLLRSKQGAWLLNWRQSPRDLRVYYVRVKLDAEAAPSVLLLAAKWPNVCTRRSSAAAPLRRAGGCVRCFGGTRVGWTPWRSGARPSCSTGRGRATAPPRARRRRAPGRRAASETGTACERSVCCTSQPRPRPPPSTHGCLSCTHAHTATISCRRWTRATASCCKHGWTISVINSRRY